MTEQHDDPPAWSDPDGLDGFTTPMTRLARRLRTWIVVIVALALVVPSGAWFVDELSFRRRASAVVATLEGELPGAVAAGAVLRVRTLRCTGTAATGSAFVAATADGPVVVTNRHVVDDAAIVGVRALDGSFDLRVTGVRLSGRADVAVLDVGDPTALPPALVLASGGARVGEAVRTVGFPAATPFTTAGRVAALADGRMLLDLEVDPGASGSPVVADDGEVVGQIFGVMPDGRGVATPSGILRVAIAEAVPAPAC